MIMKRIEEVMKMTKRVENDDGFEQTTSITIGEGIKKWWTIGFAMKFIEIQINQI